ncbi:hypothetical protein GMD78_06070 [Ornithinibacillus sp. L9]|uniref:Uncharacterized protein n=1 Tax=Ornithinibacillus caprae TaxID=2678566 RepID=A0A6N8FEL7_9BACI|nr:hypothetical protein [Ornithinibacillus caprae]MUK87963.1 hypothetical protein [Ornithinibacillus caprae]
MAVPITVVLMIIVLFFVFFMKKRLNFLQNTILYMVMAIITKNYFSIMVMELKLYKNADDSSLFISLLIDREIIIPILIVIFVNYFIEFRAWYKKIVVSIIIIGCLQLLDFFSVLFGVIEFVRWNMFYELLINMSYLLIGLGICKTLLAIRSHWEGQQYDSNL